MFGCMHIGLYARTVVCTYVCMHASRMAGWKADREQSETPEVPLEQLHKLPLPVPNRLSGEARNHRGSDQAPWAAWCPASPDLRPGHILDHLVEGLPDPC